MAESIVRKKSFDFALKIVRLTKDLRNDGDYVLSKQLLRSGTSIGANVEEALASQTRKEFHSKMTIAFKESRETHYWLRLMRESGCSHREIPGCLSAVEEIIKMLTSITKNTKAVVKPVVGSKLLTTNS